MAISAGEPEDKVDLTEVVDYIHNQAGKLVEEVGKAVVGKMEVIQQALVGILANGHILMEDFPGLGKTLMANSFARALGCSFRRIQFTPDLLPSDITGNNIYDEGQGEFVFKEGPVFANVLLADEINRAPPKTQSALLEAMQESQITVGNTTYSLLPPFLVLATQNPIEYEGTYPLPEAQVDRFMQKLSIGHLDGEGEEELLHRRYTRRMDEVKIEALSNTEQIVDLQQKVELLQVDSQVRRYMVEIVMRSRQDDRVVLGASSRGTLALFKLARSIAALRGRAFVTPDDVKAIAVPALAHRLILKAEMRIRGLDGEKVVQEILNSVPVPAI